MINHSQHPATFTQWLRWLRHQHDLTQEALAEQVYCSVQSIRAFEAGKRRPAVEMAERLAEVLAVPADQQQAFIRVARAPLAAEASHAEPACAVPGAPHPVPPLAPCPLTPLIGREAEQNILHQLLVQERCQLVTLVGAGGMGKTRLALHCAHRFYDDFPDRVGYVSLVALEQADHLPTAVAQALTIALQGGRDPEEQVLASLSERRMLLVLDNFEHLLVYEKAITWIKTLLTHASGLQLLITSRERLRIGGERIFELGGLTLPTAAPAPDQADATLLFLERAQHVVSDFLMNESNRAAIGRICQLVDGMPLGIELAAAWVRVLSCDEIADELARSIDFLERADRDAAPRHRNMRAVFEHSWALLAKPERRLLADLAYFRSGCTRQAAQRVADATLLLLANLNDKSLIKRDENGRFFLHELIRQFASEYLRQDRARLEEISRRHAEYYFELASAAENDIWGANIAAAVSRLDAESENLRAVLNYYLEHEAGAERALTLAGLLWRFWDIRGHIVEGRTWFERALARREDVPPASRWLALHGAGNLASVQSDYAFASNCYAESLHLLQALLPTLDHPNEIIDAQRGIANSLLNLGHCAVQKCEYAQAMDFTQEALTIHRQIYNQIGIALTTNNLAEIYLRQSHYEQAEHLSRAALALYRELGDDRGIAWNLRRLGNITHDRSDYPQAGKLYAESMLHFEKLAAQNDMAGLYFDLGELARVQGDGELAAAHYQNGLAAAQLLGNKRDIGKLTDRLALLALYENDDAQATRLAEQSMALHHMIGNLLGLGQAHHTRGHIAYAQADYDGAARHYRESLRLQERLGDQKGVIESLRALAALALATQPTPQQALLLWSAAEKLRTDFDMGIPPVECNTGAEILRQAQAALDEATFVEAWEAGQAMNLQQAIDYAQDIIRSAVKVGGV
ncbi:MAG: tetratricopeptide repeat protein [Caldilineaceae bacterium]